MTPRTLVTLSQGRDSIEVGTAYFTWKRNTVSTTFQYSLEYVSRNDAQEIDPQLPLHQGPSYVQGIPGAFQDCSPDRWGRNLIAKKLRQQALTENRTPPSLSDVDFLLGVSDLTRQGALRFQTKQQGPFLAPDLTVPKLVELPSLLHAADSVGQDQDDYAAIKTLLEAGSGSLGGARPKASVRDGEQLLLAKFPHLEDQWNVMAWEKTALDLAEMAGIDVPYRRLEAATGRNVLLLKRFDRRGTKRLGYISAMTMLQGTDGDSHDYTELAEAIPEFSPDAQRDLRQLWRRIAFSIAIHNTDDHLRNHGFLLSKDGWKLSPAFDMNPNPNVSEPRVTGIGGAHQRADELAGLMSYAEIFDVSKDMSHTILTEVWEATLNWRRVATQNEISGSEQNRFEEAFEGLRDEVAAIL